MPFIYEDTIQGERRNAFEIPSSREEVLTETFAQAYEENPLKALQRFSQLSDDQVAGPRLPAETARARLKDAGMENDLKVSDAGITDAALTTLMERKRIEKRRQEVFARAEGGFVEGAERFGIAALTTLADPVSAGLNFVPVVGQVRYARWLAEAGSIAGRIGVRAAVGAAEGVAGAALAEIPIYAMRTQEQADYDMADSLLNVALGGITGAGLHTLVGTTGELIQKRFPRPEAAPRVEPVITEPARTVELLPDDVQRVIFGGPDVGARVAEPLPEDIQRVLFGGRAVAPIESVIEALPPDIREHALRAAVGQAVEGRAVRVENIVAAATADSRARKTTSEFDERVERLYAERQQMEPGPLAKAIEIAISPRGRTLAERQEAISIALAAGRTEVAEAIVVNAGSAVWTARLSRPLVPAGPERTALENLEQTLRNDAEVLRQQFTSAQQQEPLAEVDAQESHVDEVLSREPEPKGSTTQAEQRLQLAKDEESLAVADMTLVAERLGIDVKNDPDFAAVMEGVEKAERWARVAELATVCLVRGG